MWLVFSKAIGLGILRMLVAEELKNYIISLDLTGNGVGMCLHCRGRDQ